ncbi:ArsR family transcriptional regulator, partial [Nonomuraea sp. NPDC004702]
DISVSKSTATHHFRVLREAGLIRQHYAGTSRRRRQRLRDR